MKKKSLMRTNLQFFAMKNLDVLKQEKVAIMQNLNKAMKDNDEATFAQAFTEFAENIQETVMMEAKGMIQTADSTVLAGRGVRVLTSEENKYYEAVIEAMKSANPKAALTAITIVFPKTVIDTVFEDLVEEHPLLDEVDFVNTSGLIEYLVNTGSAPLATWKALTATIVDELTRGFEKFDLAHKKLSAFVPVAKAMLDLGPAWLDRFVRAILQEATYNGLEKGMIGGDGLLEPVGMDKDLSAAVDPVTGYAKKTKIPVADFGMANYAGLVSLMAAGPNGITRTINSVILIVNPVDYLNKVMPATSQMINGAWVRDIFPFPTKVIQSTQVAVGDAIMGIPKKYFMGIGTAKNGTIEFSDEYHFLEDERIYLIKLYGTGRPKDNASHLLLDISKLKPVLTTVKTTPYTDATLKSIVVAGGTLSPAFNNNVTYYTTAVTAAGAFTAAATDTDSVVTMTLNGVAATNGASQTWLAGKNVVMVKVVNGDSIMYYAVVVTYTAA